MLRELVEKNRSYRGYDSSRKVSREELLELVDMTRYVASGINLQPLKYVLAWEEEKVAAIQRLTKWGSALKHMTLPQQGKCPPAFIVICHDTTLRPGADSAQVEMGAMAQTILLGAVERGLGGIMIANFSAPAMKEALDLADHLEPRLVLAIGKPDEVVKIVPVGADGSTIYYRDENDVHYVPKRDLKDIVVE